DLNGNLIPGETVFKLYDTYGFPLDLTADIARERNLTIDLQGFEASMAAQRDRARAASQFAADYGAGVELQDCTEFTGYGQLTDTSRVIGLYKGSQPVTQLEAGEQGMVILDPTAFYAESGGQVGDQGVLVNGNARFEVRDTQKQGKAFPHLGMLG